MYLRQQITEALDRLTQARHELTVAETTAGQCQTDRDWKKLREAGAHFEEERETVLDELERLLTR